MACFLTAPSHYLNQCHQKCSGAFSCIKSNFICSAVTFVNFPHITGDDVSEVITLRCAISVTHFTITEFLLGILLHEAGIRGDLGYFLLHENTKQEELGNLPKSYGSEVTSKFMKWRMESPSMTSMTTLTIHLLTWVQAMSSMSRSQWRRSCLYPLHILVIS